MFLQFTKILNIKSFYLKVLKSFYFLIKGNFKVLFKRFFWLFNNLFEFFEKSKYGYGFNYKMLSWI